MWKLTALVLFLAVPFAHANYVCLDHNTEKQSAAILDTNTGWIYMAGLKFEPTITMRFHLNPDTGKFGDPSLFTTSTLPQKLQEALSKADRGLSMCQKEE